MNVKKCLQCREEPRALSVGHRLQWNINDCVNSPGEGHLRPHSAFPERTRFSPEDMKRTFQVW